MHSKYAFKGRKVEQLETTPDIGNRVTPIDTVAGPNALNIEGSPGRILWSWFFRELNDIRTRDYHFERWDVVRGHHCAVVKMDYIPGFAVKDKPTVTFWIDLNRGGHPLRVESHLGEALAWRTDAIELAQFPLPGGKDAWLPVDGVTEFFRWGLESYDVPLVRETSHVVVDTVRLNQNLPDRAFTLGGKADGPEPAGLKAMKREFEDVSPRTRRKLRRDPKGVGEQLDKELAAADQQARMLEASSVARQSWDWPTVSIYAFATAGIFSLCAVLVMKRGQR